MTHQPPKFVSDHALDRFRERWAPMLSEALAMATLADLIRAAEIVEVESVDQAIWQVKHAGKWPILLVVSRDGVVRTVLPPGSTKPEPRRARRRR